MGKNETKVHKLVVIGLDGGCWEVLTPLLEKGLMPNLKKYISSGICGDLKSVIPPLTGPAWASFATGVNPGKHSCFGFSLPKSSLKNVPFMNSLSIKQETFYELLERNKKKVVLINLPASFPPRIKKGAVLSSFLTAEKAGVSPKSLLSKFPKLSKYRVVPNYALRYAKDHKLFVEDVLKLSRERFEIAKDLFINHPWDFFFVLFNFSDTLQHIYYTDILSDIKSGRMSPLVKAYCHFDSYLGFLSKHSEDTNFILVSDHGFEKTDYTFYLNEWLKREGYLKLQGGAHVGDLVGPEMSATILGGKALSFRSFIVAVCFRLLGRFPFFAQLLGALFRAIMQIAPFLEKSDMVHRLANLGLAPDYSKTTALSLGGTRRHIFINLKSRFEHGIVEEKARSALRRELIEKLQDTKLPNGNPVFRNVWSKEQVYHGKYVKDAPDILLDCEKVMISGDLFAGSVLKKGVGSWHAMQGIFLAWGPQIKKVPKEVKASLIDLAPTIVYAMGCGKPAFFEGKVINIFEKKFEKFLNKKKFETREKIKRRVEEPTAEEAKNIVKKRLEQLGYL